MDLFDFNEIRSWNNDEIKDTFTRITQQPAFKQVIRYIYPNQPLDDILNRFLALNNIDEFQRQVVYPYLKFIETSYTDGITAAGIENIRNEQSCLFISNHRDIILDSALLCKCMIENGLNTVEIAIGDNLLIYPWIEDFVRANKSFIVKRGGGLREMLENSKRLSGYISYVLHTKKSSIWMAQREGRAKDSNDLTQGSILKMLNMSGSNCFIENIKQLNICPVAISYEYDPCDYLKAKEFQQKRDDANFHKKPEDDLINMQTGILGHKGKVMFRFTASINAELDEIAAQTENKNEQIELTTKLIDKHIHSSYEIYVGNKVAYDMLYETNLFAHEYTLEEKQHFTAYLQGQIDKIDIPNKDDHFLLHKLLEMYSNPLKNKLNSK